MNKNRREVLAALGGAALLAACADAVPSGGAADAGGSGSDGAGSGKDGAANAPADATATADVAAPDSAQKDAGTAQPDTADSGAAKPGDSEDPKGPISPITANDDHYITSCCGVPTADLAAWRLQVADRGKVVLSLSIQDLQNLPAKQREHTLECIGTGPSGQSISNAIWTGLPLAELLALHKIALPTGKYLKFTALDGYTTGLPASDVDRPLWIVWRMNGDPLPPNHGPPARVLVPGRYGMKNPKWLSMLDFVDSPHKGFWEAMGWDDEAPYLAHTYVRWPKTGAQVPVGKVKVHGVAYAGSDPVTKVDVRIDGGPWQAATLDYAPGKDIWVIWHFDWPATKGAHTVQARCTTAAGVVSLESPLGDPDTDGYDGSMQVEVEVA